MMFMSLFCLVLIAFGLSVFRFNENERETIDVYNGMFSLKFTVTIVAIAKA